MVKINKKRLKLKRLIDNLEESDIEKAESYLTFLLYKGSLLRDDFVKSFDDSNYTKEDSIIDDLLDQK